MAAVVTRTLAVVAIGLVVLAGVLYVASTVDARGPSVASISLTQPLPDDPSSALITTSLEIAFSEPVNPSSAAAALTIEPPVPGSVSWSGSTMIFTPRDPLELATSYTVTVVAGIRDLAGNPMAQAPGPFGFQTAGRPDVVETVPADGAGDVALADPVRISFSTLMDTASVEAALELRPTFAHALRWSGQLLEVVPQGPLDADRDYAIRIGTDAFDVSGVPLQVPLDISFHTVASGLEVAKLVPADGSDGIAPTSAIAVIFDRGVEAESIADELLVITPPIAGSLELIDEVGEPPVAPSGGRVLQFTPSGALPANTTFNVELAAGLVGLGGGAMAQPVSWSFTTGAPLATLSNQITFLSARSGVPNLWAMNIDGTAPRQLSSELTSILDYAVAPDGSSFVVGDGRRLVRASADGSDRRVLTDRGLLEFDATFSPDGQRIAFGRADAATGAGLGIWQRPANGGDATRVALPPEPFALSSAAASGEPDEEPDWRRAPRYAPDGDALAFVDPTGSVGVVDLVDEGVARVRFGAEGPPSWLPDGAGILVTGRPTDEDTVARPYRDLVAPLDSGPDVVTFVLDRSGTVLEETGLGEGAAVVAVAPDGRIAYLRGDASIRITNDLDTAGRAPAGLASDAIGSVAFAPGDGANALVVVVLPPGSSGAGASGTIVGFTADDEPSVLSDDGWRPHWLP